MTEGSIYRIAFHNQGQVYELYARAVRGADLFGFIEIEGLLFGEKSSVVIDPSEETLKNEFRDVRSLMVPIHAVVRIDRVDRPGVSRIRPISGDGGKLTPFPGPIAGRPPEGPKSR